MNRFDKGKIQMLLIKGLLTLSIILIILYVPNILSFFTGSYFTKDEENIILTAAKQYINDYKEISNYTEYCLSFNTLEDSSLLSSESFVDSKLLDNYVVKYSKDTDNYQITKINYCHNIKSPNKLLSNIVLNNNQCLLAKKDNIYYLAGSKNECNNNYLWYSGKLWRVISYNTDNKLIQLIMDNSATVLQFGNNAIYDGSYIDQWLTQEFLPTLVNYNQYLSMFKFGTVDRYVGLLNSTEYNSICSNKNCYLLDNTINKSFWFIDSIGNNKINSIYTSTKAVMPTLQGLGVRPVIYMHGDIVINDGVGSIDNPYRIENNNNELLNEHTSGEYVEFDNALFRIVAIEDGMTKITSVSIPDTLQNKQFDSYSSNNYRSASINYYLNNNYYNSISDNYKAMIVPNTTWYIGSSNGNVFNYKLNICAYLDNNTSVKDCIKTTNVATATIGMPRYGELFTTQLDRSTSKTFWTLSPYYTTSLRGINDQGWLFTNIDVFPNLFLNIRPSFYLDPKVKVSCNYDYCGTYEHPYDLVL